MKKTLLLMALLGTMSATTRAEVVWTQGMDADTAAEKYTFTKYAYRYENPVPGDEYMCFAISACNTLAWWQDQVEQNGALIIPKDAPRGDAIWAKIRTEWVNRSDGGQPNVVLQYYLTGYTDWSESSLNSRLTQAGRDFIETRGGYYKHLSGAYYNWYKTALYPEYTMIKYVDARAYNSSTSEYPDGFTSYEGASEYLVQLLKEGYGGVMKTVSKGDGPHAMSFYAVETDEQGCITKIWYDDNNYDDHVLSTADVYAGAPNQTDPENKTMAANVGYGNGISSFTMLRTRGIQFDTYTLTMTGQESDEDLFSHYLNLVVDGASDYQLQYDLRDAHEKDSPVNPLIVTLDSRREVTSTEEVTTGDISLKSGQLSLIACEAGREALDGGGKTSGTITFEGAAGTERTLSVQHTATIASEIKIAAASGNTLEVTEGNTATFGKLTGTGDLDKTGTGTAEVTDEVSLAGAIRVHEGAFILGADVSLTEDTQLTVLGGGSVQGKAGKDITLSFTSGVHENNGTMTLATTVKNGAVLKGSGTFGAVALDGGRLIVGSSPGRQEYLGALSVNAGDIVFSVDGWETPADADNVGWGSGAYSNIVMHENALTFADGVSLEFAVAGDALAAMFDNSASGFTMEIATGIGNAEYFTSTLLEMLAQETIFYVATEQGATIVNDAGLSAGEVLNSRITDLTYSLKDNTTLCVTGVFMRDTPPVPEPTTGTLGLLALVALASRRRRN